MFFYVLCSYVEHLGSPCGYVLKACLGLLSYLIRGIFILSRKTIYFSYTYIRESCYHSYMFWSMLLGISQWVVLV